jgi:hypothetical protein
MCQLAQTSRDYSVPYRGVIRHKNHRISLGIRHKNHHNQRPSATQSPACTGCVELAALRAPCLLRRRVASQPLASRALVASQLVRFADSALRARWYQSHWRRKKCMIIMQNPRVLYSINVITHIIIIQICGSASPNICVSTFPNICGSENPPFRIFVVLRARLSEYLWFQVL